MEPTTPIRRAKRTGPSPTPKMSLGQISKVRPQPLSTRGHALVQRAEKYPLSLTRSDLQQLSVSAGAQAVQRVINSPQVRQTRQTPVAVPLFRPMLQVQAQLSIGPVGDKYEQEAERIARQVVGSSSAPLAGATPVQRYVIHRVQGAMPVGPQGGAVDGDIESRIRRQSSGSAMPNSVRNNLESQLGADFSKVKVHTDSAAVQLSRELGAKAFTHKNHIYYGAGESPRDLKLTAHEAVHTIQQGASRLHRQINYATNTVGQSASPGVQRKIEMSMPVRWYRRPGGSASQRANEAIAEYDRNDKNDEWSIQYRAQKLIQIKTLLERTAPRKRAQREEITKKVDLELRSLKGKMPSEKVSKQESPTKYEMPEGPKAGFEIEWPDVWIINMEGLRKTAKENALAKSILEANELAMFFSTLDDKSPQMRDEIGKAKATAQEKLNSVWPAYDSKSLTAHEIFAKARYPKRTTLFSSPHETWDGTADSTQAITSNLEIVTKPMDIEMWSKIGGVAEQDNIVFKQFVENLDKAPRGLFMSPKDLHPDLKIFDPNAVLFSSTYHPQSEGQFTRAKRLEEPKTAAPGWWIDGLNWKAGEVLVDIISKLDQAVVKGNNPKNMWDVLPKRPILEMLGKPQEPSEESGEAWVQGVASAALADKVGGLKRNALANLYVVQSTKGHWAIPRGEFTWRDYLEGLLKGRDLLTEYMATVWESEGMGLGQISDPKLNSDWTIDELRNATQVKADNVLEHARGWARKRAPEWKGKEPS